VCARVYTTVPIKSLGCSVKQVVFTNREGVSSKRKRKHGNLQPPPSIPPPHELIVIMAVGVLLSFSVVARRRERNTGNVQLRMRTSVCVCVYFVCIFFLYNVRVTGYADYNM
jgi:hypothetical protein